MIIAGIDYSINGPALCIHSGSSFSIENCKFFFLTPVKKYHQKFLKGKITGLPLIESSVNEVRYDAIARVFTFHILKSSVEQVGLEGYAYGAKGMVFHIGENTGVLKHYLWNSNLKVTTFTPAQVKNTANQKGNCDKTSMYNAFKEETNIDLCGVLSYNKSKIDSPVADIIDSFYVCKSLHNSLTIN